MENIGRKVSIGIAIVVVSSAGVILIKRIIQKKRFQAAEASWKSKVGKDVVILHQYPRPSTSISISPFPAKLETYLRMAKIKYICDYDYPVHPETKKSPWITLNGEHIADSQLALEFLSKKFNKDFSSHLGPKEKALARSLRIMIEQHLHWVLAYERYIADQATFMKTCLPGFNDFHRSMVVKAMTKQAYYQGIGRYVKGDVQRMGVEDLQALSTCLGSKLYLMGGDNPTEVDCTLFAYLCLILDTFREDCVFRIVVEKRLGNLLQFTKRMKNNYYPDWDDIIGKKSLTQLPEEKPARPPPPATNKSVPPVNKPVPATNTKPGNSGPKVPQQQKKA